MEKEDKLMQANADGMQTFRRLIVHNESKSLITRYYKGLALVFDKQRQPPSPGSFEPLFALPALDPALEEFFEVSRVDYETLGQYGNNTLRLLNLMRNPGAHTTKTLASLLITARAIQHIRRTGESIAIFTPSSGNKAIALRDAVERAITLGIVAPEQLRIITLTPKAAAYKLRKTRLSTDPELARLNPTFVVDGDDGHLIKQIGKNFVDAYADEMLARHKVRLWYSLDIRNYKVADVLRAFYDYEFGGAAGTDVLRIHAHAVSSAYGLLGFASGNEILAEHGILTGERRRPGYLLVQHMATCDMVLHLLHGSFDRTRIPAYRYDQTDGLYKQTQDPHFPQRTLALDEVIDPTFYTRQPPTSTEMSALIQRDGGTGIVVSLIECMERLGLVRALLRSAEPRIDADPRSYLEWSLPMAITGVLNAIDRSLIEGSNDIIIHGSGFYRQGDYEYNEPAALREIADHRNLRSQLQW